MPDSKIDALDVGALERSVNDSATRVSAIWLSFVAFTAYLAAAASNISHRQIFLEEPIKLPTINIDLPLVASAILLPLLFVIYHVYVLLQVVLLARTAAAYNEAIERAVPEVEDSTRMRQRLANTLFAQLFAGSPREREGVVGWLLRAMAWITLAIAPVLVLILFEVRFLPFHSAAVSWTHRGLIALDLLAVLVLWSAAVRPKRDIGWRVSAEGWCFIGAALVVVLLCVFITFPGEPTRNLMRTLGRVAVSDPDAAECWSPPRLSLLYSDRLALQGGDFVDDEKIDKVIATARSNGQRPHESPRSRSFRGRDLRCGQFAGADLRRVDFSAADLTGASFKGAHLDGAIFSGARLPRAVLDGAQLQDAYFSAEESDAKEANELLKAADLSGASLRDAQLQGASLRGVALPGARLDGAQLHGADLDGADLRLVSLSRTRLHGATLKSARLQGANMVSMDAPGAAFDEAQLQVAAIGSADLRGAEFDRSMLAGVRFNSSRLTLANFSGAHLWRATGAHCVEARVTDPQLEPVLEFEYVKGARGRGGHSVPVGPDAEGLEKFTGRAVEGLPPAAADQLRARFKERLALDAPNIPPEQSAEWRDCAGKAAADEDSYREQRAVVLAQLVCGSATNGGYIAAGLLRNIWRLMGIKSAPTFARAVLGSDGKPCPGAKDMEPRLRTDLIAAAKE